MKKYIITLAALLSVLGFIYSDFIFGGMERTSQDYVKQGMPIGKFVESEKTGLLDFPLWYNDIFGGMPFQASGTYHIKLNLESAVRAIMGDTLFKAIDGRFTIHMLLGFLFMVLLMRYGMKLDFLPAVTSGFAFILCSHILGTEHANRITTFVHVPLLLLGTMMIFDKEKLLGMLALSLGLGFQLNSYHQQITYYTMLFIGFYVLWNVVTTYIDTKTVDKKSIGYFAGAFGFGLLMGLVAIWPLQDYLPYSARGAGMDAVQKYQWMTNWCFSPKSVLDFIFPYFEGFAMKTPVDVNGVVQAVPTYWGNMPFTDYPHYLGVIVVLLAIFGLKDFKKNRNVQFVSVSAFIFLLLSFGRDLPLLYDVFYHVVPYFDKFRAPSLLLIILEADVAILAGYGIRNIMNDDKDEIFAFSKKIFIGVAVFFVGTLVLSGVAKGFMYGLYNASGKYPNDQINAIRYDLLQMDFLRLFVLTSLFHAAVYVGKFNEKLRGIVVPVTIIALLVVDLVLVGSKLVHGEYKEGTSENFYKQAKTPTVTFLLEDKSKYRIYPLDEFNENRFGYWRIETIGGYHAAKTAYIQHVIQNKLLFNRGVVDMFNIKYLISKHDLRTLPTFADVQLVKQYGEEKIFVNPTDRGRVFFSGSFSTIASEDEALNALANQTFDPVRNLFIMGDVQGELKNLTGNATGVVTSYSSNEITVDVTAQSNTIMVFSEVYYPKGWNAYVDGEKTPINRTNYMLRSLFISEGNHTVVMKFEPVSFKVSIVISVILLISLSIIFVVFMFNKFYFRKSKNVTQQEG